MPPKKEKKVVKKMVEEIEKKMAEPVEQPAKAEKKKRAPTAYAMFCKEMFEDRFKPKGMKFSEMLKSDEFKQAWQQRKAGK